MDLVHHLASFLHERYDGAAPLLLAVSGGPDSMALFQAMVECRRRRPLAFAVAHVDHGWRAESGAEAEAVARLAADAGVVCHQLRLGAAPPGANAEEWCRRQRLSFFASLCREQGYRAVLLGHHADDQAETVLKRLFEGASLAALAAMRPETLWEGLCLWRPFLAIPKKDIVAWLDERRIAYFVDVTNRDERFLRGRMRQSLMPLLTAHFGKAIAAPLGRLADEAHEQAACLERLLQPTMALAVRGPWGVYLDCAAAGCRDPYLARLTLRLLCRGEGCHFAHDQLSHAVAALLHGDVASFATGGTSLEVDRGRLFIVRGRPLLGSDELSLERLPAQWGGWHIDDGGTAAPQRGWQALWRGFITVPLPAGRWRCVAPCNSLRLYSGAKKVGDHWTEHKVPAFMRRWAPLLQHQDGAVVELLTAMSPLNGRLLAMTYDTAAAPPR